MKKSQKVKRTEKAHRRINSSSRRQQQIERWKRQVGKDITIPHKPIDDNYIEKVNRFVDALKKAENNPVYADNVHSVVYGAIEGLPLEHFAQLSREYPTLPNFNINPWKVELAISRFDKEENRFLWEPWHEAVEKALYRVTPETEVTLDALDGKMETTTYVGQSRHFSHKDIPQNEGKVIISARRNGSLTRVDLVGIIEKGTKSEYTERMRLDEITIYLQPHR